MQIYLNRSKIFAAEVDGTHQSITAPLTKNGRPVQVPDWVAETQTFKLGIKDGSIVDLTPPKPVVAAPVAEEPKGEEPKGEEPKGEEPKGEETKGEATKTTPKKKVAGESMGLQK